MSPEVCQNKPYSYQSDIWALGCILYELCTLKHAFHSENLLGLVYKIVQEEPEPIPESFGSEMQELVNLLLQKDNNKRPRIIDIIRKPFVKKHMERFVKSQGEIGNQKTVPKTKVVQHAKKIEELKTKDLNTLSDKERLRLQKEQKNAE